MSYTHTITRDELIAIAITKHGKRAEEAIELVDGFFKYMKDDAKKRGSLTIKQDK